MNNCNPLTLISWLAVSWFVIAAIAWHFCRKMSKLPTLTEQPANNVPAPDAVGIIIADRSDLNYLVNRALNTLEPNKTPKWAIELANRLEHGDKVIVVVKP